MFRNAVWLASVICTALWLGAACAADGSIDAEEAGRIALQQVGSGQIMEIDRNYRGPNGYFYRVEILAPDGKYHVELDAASGKLVKFIRKGGGRTALAPSTSGGDPISSDEAMRIALANTGGGTVVEMETEHRRNGAVVYEFEILNNGVKFDVDIDGRSGSVLEFKQKGVKGWIPGPIAAAAAAAKDPATPAPEGGASGQLRFDPNSAQNMAREQIGGGQVVKYETDWDDGRLLHEVTVVKDGARYKLEIDDATGQVVEYSRKR